MKYYFGDLECYSVNYYNKYGFVKPYAVASKSLDGEHLMEATDLNEWFDMLDDVEENTTTFFHNGGGYDFHFMLMMYSKFGKKNISLFMDAKNIIYQIKIRSWKTIKNKQKKIIHTLRDSYRLWPMPLSTLGKSVGYEKLDYGDYDILDEFKDIEEYKKYRDGKAYEYFIRDIDILRQFALQTQDILPLDKYKMTIASTAMSIWSDMFYGAKEMKFWLKKKEEKTGKWENELDVWLNEKLGYNGGFTYLMRGYELKMLYGVYVYDINSLYPDVMKNKKLPYGKPCFNENDKNHTYKLYQVHIKYAKAKYVPFISKKDNIEEIASKIYDDMHIKQELTLKEESKYPKVLRNYVVVMNNYMYDFFRKNYEGVVLEKKNKFLHSFKEQYDMFSDYINKFMIIKQNAIGAIRLLMKLILNALYGKYGQNIEEQKTSIDLYEDVKDKLTFTDKLIWYKNKIVNKNGDYVYLKEEGNIKNTLSYIPIASAITTHARIKLVKAIIANIGNFIYCDTDSIHLTSPAKGIKLHPTNFGDWKFEGKWDNAVYRRAKHYYHINNDGTYELKGGGLNVGSFSPETLSLKQYQEPDFVIKDGKKGNIFVSGGKIIFLKDYKFTMPEWFTPALDLEPPRDEIQRYIDEDLLNELML